MEIGVLSRMEQHVNKFEKLLEKMNDDSYYQKVNKTTGLMCADLLWAIEQGKMVEKLDEVNQKALDLLSKFEERQKELENKVGLADHYKKSYYEVLEENKHYLDQLNLIRADTFCADDNFVSVKHVIRKRAEKALNGDSQ